MVQTLPYISTDIFGGCCIFHAKYFWRGCIVSTESYIWHSSLFIVTFSLPNISGAAVASLLSATYGTVLHTGLIHISFWIKGYLGLFGPQIAKEWGSKDLGILSFKKYSKPLHVCRWYRICMRPLYRTMLYVADSREATATPEIFGKENVTMNIDLFHM